MNRWLPLLLGGSMASMAADEIPPLPVPIANNTTALITLDDGVRIYSFLGLLSGKTWRDVSDRAFEYDSRRGTWREIDRVPGGQGRLAGIAQVVDGKIYLFGGYTVAEDGSESSVPRVHRFDPASGEYSERAPMPVPVDDTVAAVYQDRYIVLVSGWHDTDNVDHVQVYDTVENTWQQATPWPGPALFGHAGGLVDDTLVVCDGVKVVPLAEPGKREFRISDACFLGRIDPQTPTAIHWQSLPPHPGEPRYRMAASGVKQPGRRVLFAAGSDNPYNYNGIGYNGEPSAPSAAVFSFDLDRGSWVVHKALSRPTMDHRNLLRRGRDFLIVGGIGPAQQVLDSTQVYALDQPEE